MTSVSDFATRDRAATGATQSVPLSTISHDSPALERRGSIGSALSARTSNDLRYKHPARSNTVKTYRQPEQEEPGWQPGAEPGIDTSADSNDVPAEVKNIKAKCDINIVDFSDVDVRHLQANNESLAQALVDPRPDDMPCRWISVNGLSWDVIQCLGNKFNLHRLAIEDIIRTKSRTKVDWYADHACIILTLQKLVRLHQDNDEDVDDHSHRKQPQGNWWQRWNRPNNQSELPYYLDKDGDGQIDEFVNAHSSTSTEAPIKQVRTLHRYENAQIPESTLR